MTDREYLELAAKAAGYELGYVEGCDDVRKSPDWNPLTDDGDRYRLARECHLVVDFQKCLVLSPVGMFGWAKGNKKKEAYAIVRAAAEIGKGMK